MRRTELLLAFATIFIVTAAAIVNLPTAAAQQQPTIAVTPTVIDTRTLKAVGDTFSLNVTLANIEKLWGYEFTLFYNDSFIKATGQTGLDSRFARELAVDIGSNYTHVSRGTFNGDTVGVTSTPPLAVEKIDFVVTGSGTSNITFDPVLTQLANIYGALVLSIPQHVGFIVNGKFSNTQTLETHNVGITQAALSTTSATIGDQVTVTVTISNLGDFNENVTAGAKYNTSLTFFNVIGNPQTITNLAKGTNNQLTFTWDTTNVGKGLHDIIVTANVTVDDNPSDNTFFVGAVTLGSGTTNTGIPWQYIIIGVAVAIIVIAGIAVYALRARGKPGTEQ